MSEVHVHGVTSAGERAAIEGAGGRAIVHGPLAAIVSDAVEGARAADLMRRHWHLLEATAATATVVPVQFGTAMSGEAAVADEFLAPREDDLVAQLAALEGKVQMTVKGSYDETALMRSVVASSPAIAKLRERVRSLPEAAGHFERIRLGELVAAAVEDARERDAAWLLEELGPIAVATSREAASGLDAAFNAAFLVERDHVAEFGRAVDAAAGDLSGRIELRLLGPLPPYSFAGEGARAWA
jgi:hypothetical protein